MNADHTDDQTESTPVPHSGLKARVDKETVELKRTLKMLDAKIDVMAGTNRLGAYEHRPRRAHERGGQ